MALALNPEEHAKLVELACRDFHHGYRFGIHARHTGRVSARAGEVIMVSQFCLSMIDAARSWNTELQRLGKPYALTVSTVFTHQRPYVRFASPTAKPSCELADMLVVVVDRTTTAPSGTALLLQAKLSDDHHVTLRNDSEKKQFELFEQHPSFNMRAGGPQGVVISQATARAGLRYGITGAAYLGRGSVYINQRRWRPHAWYNSSPIAGVGLAYRVDARECIAHMLVDMLTMQAGGAFVPNHVINTAAPSTWDDVINYLLQVTFNQTLNTMNPANAGRPIRGAEVVMSFMTAHDEGFLAAITAPGDTAGPVAWLRPAEGAGSKDALDGAEEDGLENFFQKMIDRMEREWSETRSSEGGSAEPPPEERAEEGEGGISAIVIEIVNSEGRRPE